MATVGLKGIWGLEQLDKTGIATWKLGLMLVGGGVLLGALLTWVLDDVNPNSVLASTFTPTLVSLGILATFVIMHVNFWLVLALSRTTEADLQLLPLTDDVRRVTMKRLRPRKKELLTQPIGNSLFFTTLLLGIVVSISEASISEAFVATYTSGQMLILTFFVVVPMMGLTQGLVAAFANAQQSSLLFAARHIEIDLLRLDDYSVIANPAVRISLNAVAMISIFPQIALLGGSEVTGEFLWTLTIVSIMLNVGAIAIYGYPVLILRNRIRDKKKLELDKVYRCLHGEKEAVSTITIQGLGAPTTTADLLTHRMFLHSLWDWPVATHVQKLVLFGLLPPVTWVVATMIENAMY